MELQEFQLIKLSTKFHIQFTGCTEIIDKPTRMYLLIVIQINGLTFATPLRSRTPKHKHTFITTDNLNETRCLDYTKTIIVNQYHVDKILTYNDVNQKNKILSSKDLIKCKLNAYIEKYKSTFRKLSKGKYHYNYCLLCSRSALRYFHAELELEDPTIIMSKADQIANSK